ncbi:MAG: flagellar biosynthesis repressor FlbT [Alphaproteobacteria bacterium]|nr:flagellar biosynthesis repressor FlbT [Alphaproteobacteria bacterium]
MPGLMLKLRPFESVMVNGALIENGKRESRLRIATDNVNVLRLREALEPHEVTSPLAEAYYSAQLAVIGAIDIETARASIRDALDRASDRDDNAPADARAEIADAVDRARPCLEQSAFYRVMRAIAPALRASPEEQPVAAANSIEA